MIKVMGLYLFFLIMLIHITFILKHTCIFKKEELCLANFKVTG